MDGVPQGKVEQFEIDSNQTKIFNPGIARKEFGKVDPKNPKSLIVETHTIDYKRAITVRFYARPSLPLPLLAQRYRPGRVDHQRQLVRRLLFADQVLQLHHERDFPRRVGSRCWLEGEVVKSIFHLLVDDLGLDRGGHEVIPSAVPNGQLH
jgi:hypothetical protein